MKFKPCISLFLFILSVGAVFSQTGSIRGEITSGGNKIGLASLHLTELKLFATADGNGNFEFKNLPEGTYMLQASSVGFATYKTSVAVQNDIPVILSISLVPVENALDEVVVTGTMKEVSRLDSPVPVEVFTHQHFKKNPTPSLFEAIGMVNGVQPQLNCNVCNTGDIHINGMEGPYTMILIDGMPIVSSLSSVYGLSGIPNSMVERIEVVKGPASSLYGSEAMGGIINVITKDPAKAPVLSLDVFATNWQEYSTDAAMKFKVKKAQSLLGVNYFNYQKPVDKNDDGFTDATLQHRISVFNKWSWDRKHKKVASIAGRYVYEDRWGGEVTWNKSWRGMDSIYGESIYTRRWELVGAYQLPVKEKIMTQFSYNWHDQNSFYGNTSYMANQRVAFGQIYWDKEINIRHNFLLGAAVRYTYYDDNTPGTASADSLHNAPMQSPLPGMFLQDEWTINEKHKILMGYRYDFDKHHGSIHSPRVAYRYSPNRNHTLRASFGTGFRVVNLFTEDHAALTGAREVVIKTALNPERSYNANVNYVLKIPADKYFLSFDMTGFYSYFTNKITGDFETDPTKIIYDNLNGYAISRGLSLNTDLTFNFPLKILAGASFMDVYLMEEGTHGGLAKSRQLHAPVWSGTFAVSYGLPKKLSVDLTGDWNGPMRLPILPDDYRPEYSPWFCIANLQLTRKFSKGLELYGGIKNIFNFVPKDPIMRPFDPFNKQVNDELNNPFGYQFDPSYNYASMQGIRMFIGTRWSLQ